jgi:hypothetical protein
MNRKQKHVLRKTQDETLNGIFEKSPELLVDGAETKIQQILIDICPRRNPALNINNVYVNENTRKMYGVAAVPTITRKKRKYCEKHGIIVTERPKERTPEEELFHYHG